MRNAVLLNAAKKKRKKPKKAKRKKAKKVRRNVVGDGRRGPGTPAQREYRALVKKFGSVTKAAAAWRKRKGGRAAANTTMPTAWKKKVKSGVSKKKRTGMGSAWTRKWKSGVAGFNRKKNPAVAVLLKEAATLRAMKAGVPVIFSALSGYFVPFYLMQRYPTKVKGLVQHAIGVGTATVAGAATALLTKSGVIGLAAFASALGGYLIPTVGVKVMAKLLPAPTGTAGFGATVDEAIDAGIQKAMRETGLAQSPDIEESIVSAQEALRLGRMGQIVSEKQVAEARQLSPTASGLSQIVSEEQVADAPELSPTVGEFGLGMRGLI